MTVITTGSHPKALWPGVRKWWGVEYSRYEPIWPQMFEKLTSEKAYEEDAEDIGFGLMQVKQQNGGIAYDVAQQGAVSRYVHITWALGYQVTLEELEDNLYTEVSFKRTTRLARSLNETSEVVHANVFNRAFNSSFTGGDGVCLCSASHPTANGNQSNLLTVASDLSEASIEDMCVQIYNAVDSRGLRFKNVPKSLLVSNSDWFNAYRIVNSVQQNDTANNAVNVVKAAGVFPGGVVRNPYFTDTDAWFIRTDCLDGLIHFTRKEATFDKDNDFETKNAKASVIARWSQGWTNWRQLYGTPGA